METQKMMLYSIPIMEFKPRIKPRGLFFLVHGHGGNKEDGVGEFPRILTNLGFLVVSVDAYMHGERKEEPYITGNLKDVAIAMIDVVIKTTQDILLLFSDYYSKQFQSFHMLGISMGGHIAYQLPRHSPHVDTIIAIIGSPDMKAHYDLSKQPIIGTFGSELNRKLLSLSVHKDLYLYHNTAIFALNGELDQVVSSHFAKKFILELSRKGHHKAEFKSYECGHVVTKEMKEDIIYFIEKNI
ncbi:MAG TPA: dienelactone hydrolase family protein [Bacilli bacterium]|nr:dienelactone hydrolase family protein [Bacilli bacterium]